MRPGRRKGEKHRGTDALAPAESEEIAKDAVKAILVKYNKRP
jgi:hypothetical protein